MTLDEAIKRAEEVVEEQEKAAKEWHENQVRKCKLIRGTEMDYTHENECKKCAEEHKQLAEWLKELKQLREQESKIKVLDDMEAAKRLGTVDVYMASAWLKFIKNLKILGLRVCEVTESEGEE